jgi:Fic family protein
MVIEQGITIAGKPLRDHLKALDHYDAIRYVRELARASGSLTQMDIRNLHRLVMLRSTPEVTGQYADQGRHVFPSPAELRPLMETFAAWLAEAPMTPDTAFAAHRRLVDTHPFNDGNGRTARLLMNLVLIRGGYPPVPVRPEDRPRYIAALNLAQDGGGDGAFRTLLYERLDVTMDELLQAYGQARPVE